MARRRACLQRCALCAAALRRAAIRGPGSRARMDSIRNWFDCSFKVTNEAGQVVLVLPFSETVNENEATRERDPEQSVISEADALGPLPRV